MLDLPSLNHPNRQAFNWLAYNCGDHFLVSNKQYYRGRLYDLGCGEMPYRDWFLRYADTYTGVDWAGTLHTLKADIIADLNEPLPIEDRVADTVVSLSVMEHLCEPQLFLNEAYRILKSGGVMILQAPFMWWVHEAPHDYFRYTRYGLKYMFEKAGFSDVEVYPQTGFWIMLTLKFNYQSTKLIRGPWPVRKMMSLMMHLIWTVDQRVAPWLDKHWTGEEETAGYYVLAQKK
ncbi:MAG: class I SAM-dependent methyltransferase [Deltaproteobacteria bacterium]